MKTFNVNGNLGKFVLNLPESLSEISNDYFKHCTDFVNPAPDYALVAIVYKDSLSFVLTAAKKKQPVNAAIIPIFIKAGESNSEFINNIKLGDKIVISGSDLSMGHHINSPYNKITPTNIIAVCDGDKDIYKEAMLLDKPICLVEFKLVPTCAIHGKLDKATNSFINPFITKATVIDGEA